MVRDMEAGMIGKVGRYLAVPSTEPFFFFSVFVLCLDVAFNPIPYVDIAVAINCIA